VTKVESTVFKSIDPERVGKSKLIDFSRLEKVFALDAKSAESVAAGRFFGDISDMFSCGGSTSVFTFNSRGGRRRQREAAREAQQSPAKDPLSAALHRDRHVIVEPLRTADDLALIWRAEIIMGRMKESIEGLKKAILSADRRVLTLETLNELRSLFPLKSYEEEVWFALPSIPRISLPLFLPFVRSWNSVVRKTLQKAALMGYTGPLNQLAKPEQFLFEVS
jgi:hypothetical protein